MDLKFKNNSQLAWQRYIPVEYIESNGSPNINTGVTWSMASTSKNKVDCTIQVINSASSTSYLYIANYSNSRRTYLQCNSSATSFKVASSWSSGSVASVTIDGKSNVIHTYSKITVNDVDTSITSQAPNGDTAALYILPSSNGNLKVRFWELNIYNQSGNLAAQYIPVISLEDNHLGEACFYNKTTNNFVYSSSTGSFTAYNPTSIFNEITSAYVKDCPNISEIALLKLATNLERVRCDINNITGPINDIYNYSFLSGFNDNYEQQVKPRLVGTFNINNFYIDSEVSNIRDRLDGTTVVTPTAADYDVDYLLDNDLLAVQNLNDEVENYNPTVATILNNNGIGHNTDFSFYPGFGTYLIKKTEAAATTSWPIAMFRGNTTVETFNEFKYWTGLTSLPGGNDTTDVSRRGSFGGCTALTSIEIPEGITTIGAVTFYGDAALSRIVLPSTLTTINDNNFNDCSNLANVYFNGTLSNWMNISFHQTGISNPTSYGAHFYIDGEELTSLTIPQGTTSIKTSVFYGMKYITGQLVIPNTVTSIGASAFRNCSGAVFSTQGSNAGVLDLRGISTGDYAFANNPGITKVYLNNDGGYNTFDGCMNLEYLEQYNYVNLNVCRDGGNSLGTIIYHSDFNGSAQNTQLGLFKNVIFYGNITLTTNYLPFSRTNGITQTFRVKGNFIGTSNAALTYQAYSYTTRFIEMMGTSTHNLWYNVNFSYNGFIIHLGYSGVAMTGVQAGINSARCAKVYVGDGSSKSGDEAVLALYTADSNWSSYTSKLGTWWDYNGEYKWYRVTENLTHCTNSNSVEWPFITRNNSYETTIIADEGCTIERVKVLMYECADNTATPATPTDITNDVYDASTGTIHIEHVIGNVEIKASAI